MGPFSPTPALIPPPPETSRLMLPNCLLSFADSLLEELRIRKGFRFSFRSSYVRGEKASEVSPFLKSPPAFMRCSTFTRVIISK